MSELKEVMPKQQYMQVEDVLKLERAHHEHDLLVKQGKAAQLEAKVHAQQRTIMKYMMGDAEAKQKAADASHEFFQKKAKDFQEQHKEFVQSLQEKYGLEKGFGINPETFEIIQGGTE